MVEMNKWPFQASSINFNFTQDNKGWWNTKAKMVAERSEDGVEWEVAEIAMSILDKDYAHSVSTCWSILMKTQQECGGDIFSHKDSKVYSININEEQEQLPEEVVQE